MSPFVSRLVRLGLTAALLTLILWKVSPRALAEAMRGAQGAPLAAGLVLGLVFVALKVVRWGWLLRCAGIAATAAESLYSFLGGMAVGLITPGRVGEVARSLYLRTSDKGFVTGAALLDKLFDIAIIVAVGAAGCFVGGYTGTAALMAALAAGLILGPMPPASVIDAVIGLVPIAAMRRVASGLASPLRRLSRGQIAFGFFQGAISFATTMIQFHVFLTAFDTSDRHVPFQATLFAFPLVVLSNLVPLTLSGLGVREGVAAFLLAPYGVPGAVAVNTALLVYAANSLLPGLIGALLAPRWKARQGPAAQTGGLSADSPGRTASPEGSAP